MEKNFVTIGSIKNEINQIENKNPRLRVFRASQPNSVFMSNHEINVDIRENYVGNPNFPGFALQCSTSEKNCKSSQKYS